MRTNVNDIKLITEFMGTFHACDSWGREQDFIIGAPNRTYKGEIDPPYHKSWDWLMPVLDKICDISNGDRYRYRIMRYRCIIYDSNVADSTDVLAGKGDGIIAACVNYHTTIESVYTSVIEFIKWHNSQSPSNPSQPKPDDQSDKPNTSGN